MMGCGGDKKQKVVWVAVRIPDDAICAHANQSRIGKFNMKDKANVLYAKDVVSFARSKGWYTGKDADKDFKKKFLPALRKVLAAYPQAKVQQVRGGVLLNGSPPPIPLKGGPTK